MDTQVFDSGYLSCIYNMVNEGCRVIVFGTCIVQVSKISIDTNGALFFHDGYRVRNPRGVSDRKNETNFVKLVDFLLDRLCFRRM